MAFWEELALAAFEAAAAGTRRAPLGSVDEANARSQRLTRQQSLPEVRARAAASHAGVLAAIQGASDAEWSRVFPGKRKRTLADIVGGTLGAPKRPFGHAFAHLADLEAYVRSLGR